jgi:hypothetical protein
MADGITIRAQNFRFDGKNFNKVMDRELGALFTEAARAFLIAAVRRIPIRTGFLRGAFTRLEDVVGAYQIGASKKEPSFLGAKGKGPGTRPNRDVAVVARRLTRLRETQRRTLKQIKQLQNREAGRRRILNKKISELQNAQGGIVHEKQLAAILRENRAAALIDRNKARFLLKQGKLNAEKISDSARRFEAKYEVKLNTRASDERNMIRLRLLDHQQTRNDAFQRGIKRLRKAYFGGVDRTPGKFGQRIPGTISRDEFDRRLKKLREDLKSPTKLQQQLRERLTRQPSTNSAKLKTRLAEYTQRLREKYAERLSEAQAHGDQETIERIALRVQKKLARAKRKISRKLAGSENVTGADKLLGELQRQARHRATLSEEQIDALDHQLDIAQGRLNVVARTTRGRIVGQNIPGKFNLRGSERVKTIFNKAGTARFEEFYYPVKGAPQARILKTPRSGRKFSTPAQYIISKVTKKPQASLGLLRQLAGIMHQTGRSVLPEVDAAIKDIGETISYYQFNFAVDISYLAVNDAKQAWLAWDAAVKEFNRVITSQTLKRLPSLDQFMLVETRRLSPTSSSTTVSRGR